MHRYEYSDYCTNYGIAMMEERTEANPSVSYAIV